MLCPLNSTHEYQNLDATINKTGVLLLSCGMYNFLELLRALMSSVMMALCNKTDQETNTNHGPVDMDEADMQNDDALELLSVI